MSLLLEDVERRWQEKLQDTERDWAAHLRAVEAKARILQTETVAAANKAIADAQREVREALKRENDALEAARAAEARADFEAARAEGERKRCEEIVELERAASKGPMEDMQRKLNSIQVEADRRCELMRDMLDRANAEKARAIQESCKATTEAQFDAEQRLKAAEAASDEAIQAAQALSLAHISGANSHAVRADEEAQQRIEQAQLDAESRVESATRHGLDALNRSRAVANARDALDGRAASV